ncbi:hypothetical protein ES703_70386 [subsurface metagenome]
MKDTAIVSIGAFLAIAVIVVAAVVMGHNSAIITGALATIAGIAGGVGAYSAGKAKYPQWHDDRVRKEQEHNDQSNPPKPD